MSKAQELNLDPLFYAVSEWIKQNANYDKLTEAWGDEVSWDYYGRDEWDDLEKKKKAVRTEFQKVTNAAVDIAIDARTPPLVYVPVENQEG